MYFLPRKELEYKNQAWDAIRNKFSLNKALFLKHNYYFFLSLWETSLKTTDTSRNTFKGTATVLCKFHMRQIKCLCSAIFLENGIPPFEKKLKRISMFYFNLSKKT